MDSALTRKQPCGTCKDPDGNPTGRVPSGKWLAFVQLKQTEVSAAHDAKHPDPSRRAQAAKDLAGARDSLQRAFPCGLGDDGEPLWRNSDGVIEKCPKFVPCNTCGGTKQQIVMPSIADVRVILERYEDRIAALEAALKKAGLLDG